MAVAALAGACADFEFQRGGPHAANGGGGGGAAGGDGPVIIVNGGTDSGAWSNNPDAGPGNGPDPDAGAPRVPDAGGSAKPDSTPSPPPEPDAGIPQADSTAPGPTGACGSPEESEVFTIVNQERAKRGLSPMACDLKGSAVARAYSEYMCTAGFFSHTGRDGSSPWSRLKAGGVQFRGAGENIAAGQRTPSSVMVSWMNSSGHRANILGNYTHIGIGYGTCSKGYKHYWTQVFMRR